MRTSIAATVFACLAFPCSPASGQASGASTAPDLRLPDVPIHFVENRGAYPEDVSHFVRARDTTFFFTSRGVTLRQHEPDRAWTVELSFVGAAPRSPVAASRRRAVFSDFRGPRASWRTGVPSFGRLVYRDLWPGIDLAFHGASNELKYEFRVWPGADPGAVRMRYDGATGVRVAADGSLVVDTPLRPIVDAPPVAFQPVRGEREPVDASFRLHDDGSIGFDVGAYDARTALVIDPGWIAYCGYFGGAHRDWIKGIAVDAAGYAYIVGTTESSPPSFPVRVGPDLSYNGPAPHPNQPWADVFVAKLGLSGAGLVYCGYIGGSAPEKPGKIAVDAAGSAYVTGTTRSDERSFPVTVGPGLRYGGGRSSGDGFVAKVHPAGASLDYCGYIGGTSDDTGEDIVVDGSGAAYVTGITWSDERTFPVKGGPDLTFNGASDAFVAKVAPGGATLVYCGYIGGNLDDYGNAVAVDAAGRAYVAGHTFGSAASFPLRAGPTLVKNASFDGYIARIAADGSRLEYCGYIGGVGLDFLTAVDVDATGAAYVAGQTTSAAGLPLLMGPSLRYGGGLWGDALVAKVAADGTFLHYCGYIGGVADDLASGIAVDASGRAYVCGSTHSDETSFPVAGGPAARHGGLSDAFVARVDVIGTRLEFAGYVGGAGSDGFSDIALGADGAVYAAGSTQTVTGATALPFFAGPEPAFLGGFSDGLVVKLDFASLAQSGRPGLGQRVVLQATAPTDVGLGYAMMSSLGGGSFAVDTRRIPVSLDPMAIASVTGALPSIFASYRGVIDATGQASASIRIPGIPPLAGNRIHTTLVTLDPRYPSGIRSITAPVSFTIVP